MKKTKKRKIKIGEMLLNVCFVISLMLIALAIFSYFEVMFHRYDANYEYFKYNIFELLERYIWSRC